MWGGLDGRFAAHEALAGLQGRSQGQWSFLKMETCSRILDAHSACSCLIHVGIYEHIVPSSARPFAMFPPWTLYLRKIKHPKTHPKIQWTSVLQKLGNSWDLILEICEFERFSWIWRGFVGVNCLPENAHNGFRIVCICVLGMSLWLGMSVQSAHSMLGR